MNSTEQSLIDVIHKTEKDGLVLTKNNFEKSFYFACKYLQIVPVKFYVELKPTVRSLAVFATETDAKILTDALLDAGLKPNRDWTRVDWASSLTDDAPR